MASNVKPKSVKLHTKAKLNPGGVPRRLWGTVRWGTPGVPHSKKEGGAPYWTTPHLGRKNRQHARRLAGGHQNADGLDDCGILEHTMMRVTIAPGRAVEATSGQSGTT